MKVSVPPGGPASVSPGENTTAPKATTQELKIKQLLSAVRHLKNYAEMREAGSLTSLYAPRSGAKKVWRPDATASCNRLEKLVGKGDRPSLEQAEKLACHLSDEFLQHSKDVQGGLLSRLLLRPSHDREQQLEIARSHTFHIKATQIANSVRALASGND